MRFPKVQAAAKHQTWYTGPDVLGCVVSWVIRKSVVELRLEKREEKEQGEWYAI